MNLTKAFDTVPRELLFKKLREAGVSGKILGVIQNLYSNNRAKVRINEYESEYFSINSGVMQGSKLGPILFNIFINDLLKILHDSGLGAALQHITVTAIAFADDVIFTAEDPSKLKAPSISVVTGAERRVQGSILINTKIVR